MKRLAITTLFLVASSTFAMATSDLDCHGKDYRGREVSISFEWGAGIASVFDLRVGLEVFATPSDISPLGAQPIHIVSANDDGRDDKIVADFSLTRGGPIVASLKTYKFLHPAGDDRADNRVSAGVFWFKDRGEWAVLCDTP